MGIYKITNKVNGKFYIGSSNNLNKRWQQHISELNNQKHYNPYLQKSFNKYGIDKFSFDILEIIECEELLLKLEQKYMDELKPEYNLCPIAGSALVRITSPEVREKLRLAGLGKKYSKERIEKSRREQIKFWKEHPEARELARIKSTGVKDSKETRKKKSEALKKYLSIPKNYKKRIIQLNSIRGKRHE